MERTTESKSKYACNFNTTFKQILPSERKLAVQIKICHLGPKNYYCSRPEDLKTSTNEDTYADK